MEKPSTIAQNFFTKFKTLDVDQKDDVLDKLNRVIMNDVANPMNLTTMRDYNEFIEIDEHTLLCNKCVVGHMVYIGVTTPAQYAEVYVNKTGASFFHVCDVCLHPRWVGKIYKFL